MPDKNCNENKRIINIKFRTVVFSMDIYETIGNLNIECALLILNTHLFLCVTTVLSCYKTGLWSFSTHWNTGNYGARQSFQNNMEWGKQILKIKGYWDLIFVGECHSIFVNFKSILSKMFTEMGRGMLREPNWIDKQTTFRNVYLTSGYSMCYLFF